MQDDLLYVYATAAVIVGLLVYKGLYLTSALYLLYQVLCVMGLLEWLKARQEVTVPAD